MYAIICDAPSNRKDDAKILGYVNRDKCQDTWWTANKPNLVLAIDSVSTASKIKARFIYNNPRIVKYHEAIALLTVQATLLALSKTTS